MSKNTKSNDEIPADEFVLAELIAAINLAFDLAESKM